MAAEGGLEELTLAAQAGVGRPTIYRRRASKVALMEEAMRKMVQQMVVVPQRGGIRELLDDVGALWFERMVMREFASPAARAEDPGRRRSPTTSPRP